MSQTPVNPANAPVKAKVERDRIPMSLPQLKLAVPEIPGYHLHWMRGTPSRISQALRAGYEFVNDGEVEVLGHNVAGIQSGNTDMGTRVSVLAGQGVGEDGREERLYLMKIKQEWWEADQKALEDRNEQVAAALRGGQMDAGAGGDASNRYIPEAHKKGVADLFTRKIRR